MDRGLLTGRRGGVDVGTKILKGEGVRVLEVSIQRQEKGGSLLHDAHPRMRMSVNASLVPFGVSKPAFQIQVVLGKVQEVASREQAGRETSHHLTNVSAEGIPTSQERAPDLVERGPAVFRGTVFRIERRFYPAEVLNLPPNPLVGFLDGREPSIDASGEPLEVVVRGPPFLASRLRCRDSRTSPKASAILIPGGRSGPP